MYVYWVCQEVADKQLEGLVNGKHDLCQEMGVLFLAVDIAAAISEEVADAFICVDCQDAVLSPGLVLK